MEKGKVFRKEGEKRRKKIGNREAAEGNFCIRETSSFFLLHIISIIIIMNLFAERDKVKKRKNPKENSAQAAPAPKVQ